MAGAVRCGSPWRDGEDGALLDRLAVDQQVGSIGATCGEPCGEGPRFRGRRGAQRQARAVGDGPTLAIADGDLEWDLLGDPGVAHGDAYTPCVSLHTERPDVHRGQDGEGGAPGHLAVDQQGERIGAGRIATSARSREVACVRLLREVQGGAAKSAGDYPAALIADEHLDRGRSA